MACRIPGSVGFGARVPGRGKIEAGGGSRPRGREGDRPMAIATVNPATGETLKTYEPLSDEALEEKLDRAATAWASYRRTSPEQRAGWLNAAADVLDGDAGTVAELMTTE